MKSLLIFPAVSADAWEQARAAQREQRPCVLAASMPAPPVGAPAGAQENWAVLPTIYAVDFRAEFDALVARRDVGAVYSPVPAVHAFLRRFLRSTGSPVVLVNEAPIERQVRVLGEIESLANEVTQVACEAAGGEPGLQPLELRAVIEAAMSTYGESGPEKIAAMAGVMASACRGDVVEIGTLMGRSATALRLLARRYGIGAVLTVDPWAPAEAVQADSPAVVRDDLIGQWDYERLARGFTARMYALGDTDFAHLRLPSRLAFDEYCARPLQHFEPFKPVRFSGTVSVLHIDGNHDYTAVQDDWQRWGSRLVDGAWVIFDDYIWAHGDGPRRLGDEVMARWQTHIGRSFVKDKALFVQFLKRPVLG